MFLRSPGYQYVVSKNTGCFESILLTYLKSMQKAAVSLAEETVAPPSELVLSITETIHRTKLRNREWETARGSPHHKPVHHKPTPLETEGLPLGTYFETFPTPVQRRWETPQGSPVPHHRKPKPVHWGPKEHPKPTAVKSKGAVLGTFDDEASSALIHRRWEHPQGSPSHKPTRSGHKPWSTSSSISTSEPVITLSSTLPISDCTSITPGATDTPANRNATTGRLSRSTCGITDGTVEECPWLCMQGNEGLFNGCYNEDFTGVVPLGEFPPLTCQQCLPPCHQTSSTSILTKIGIMSTATIASTAMNTACTRSDPFVGTVPSTKDKSTGAFLRFECGLSFQLAYECPYLCGYDVGNKLGECCEQDNSTSIAKDNHEEYSCTHCFYPSRKFAAPSSTSEATCTPIDPNSPPCPPSVRFDDSIPPIRYQTACGTQANEINDCPYLCTSIDRPDQYHCENEDLGGTVFKPTGLIQACIQCLPAC